MTSSTFGLQYPDLFRFTSVGYAFVALTSLSMLLDKTSYQSALKILLLLTTDLVAMVLLIHASGGLTGGLGYLLVINAAIASMFLRSQLAFAYAALVSIALILHTLLTTKGDDATVRSVFAAGILGSLIFITTIAFRYLTDRIQRTTEEAAKSGAYARQVVKLAQLIVTRMQTGITVLDNQNNIELINDSALQHLELPKNENYLGQDLTKFVDLNEELALWHRNPISGLARVHKLNGKKEIRINFAAVETDKQPLTIMYIEDHRTLMQQAQQLKLASLGRLTASIAHEIRNPLGAISHAAQLLSESEYLDKTDTRFTEIILQHTQRVNEIVENTMSLSKRKEPKAEEIDLKHWIPQFIDEYSTAKDCEIKFEQKNEQENIKMDPAHLRQILSNLFDNGLRYSMENTGTASIHIRSGTSKHNDMSILEIIDFGLGVPDEEVGSIFEPFFTTGQQGTGLGLYISRELCEINQARLDYKRTLDNKSRFIIYFSHHQRMI